MKKVAIMLLAVATLAACKPSKKETKKDPNAVSYELDTKTVVVNWTGYKFTNKTGVKGQFKEVEVKNTHSGASMSEALKGLEFSIPVSSVFSNNDARDTKLQTLFFGIMNNTELLKGTVKYADAEGCVVAITMNGETHDLPFATKTQGNTAYLKAILNINTWNAQGALASLHKACELLHTGEDGVSKTWNTVDLDIVLNFKK